MHKGLRREKTKATSVDKGCYTLVISLQKTQRLQIGKLGTACFPRGLYFYTGSALGGLTARIARHLRKRNKKIHWHIDYLLRGAEARITNVLLYPPGCRECRQNQKLAALFKANVMMRGFGASDCASGCKSHLLFLTGQAARQGIKRLKIIERLQYSR